MDNFKRFSGQVRSYLFVAFLCSNVFVVGLMWAISKHHDLTSTFFLIILATSGLLALLCAYFLTRVITEPVAFLEQAILHVNPGHSGTAPPNLGKNRVGRELITALSLQVYQLASSLPLSTPSATISQTTGFSVIDHLPLPLLTIDKTGNIRFVNEAALAYVNLASNGLIGKNLYSVFDLSFQDEQTLDNWLADCRAHKVTASRSWEHVRLKLANQPNPLQFDLAASYSKDTPDGTELILALFDHAKRYTLDDEAAGYVALAVHELRTPLTILRGYIEVFEDELGDKLDPEMVDFMHKMQVSAESLSAFVNNILNVARVEENQLTLELHEEQWSTIISSVVVDMQLRAQVHGKIIQAQVAADLPTVAVDKVSIYEVLNNLLDNAIKYSNTAKQIEIRSHLTEDGLVETTVQDFGVGIPASVLPNLFDKFYRSHRSRAQVGGTGLGLYLSKAIVKAHSGQIWVRSKEGEGSTFGFTLVPFAKLADELKNVDNKEITRSAHGWIKNHSLYRR